MASFLRKVQSIFELPQRVLGPLSSIRQAPFEKEHHSLFSISRARINRNRGVSALIRCKNEAKNIEMCVSSIVGVFDEIVVVDNGSTDSTAAIVTKLSQKFDNIRFYSYPFKLMRCGTEHEKTPEFSVRNITYYTNWCLSKCNRSYIMKWDADMVLDLGSKDSLVALLSSVSSYWPTFIATQQQTIYEKDDCFYESIGEVNSEVMLFPNRSDVLFKKHKSYELLTAKHYRAITTTLDYLTIYEIKRMSDDEFAHWDGTDFPTQRKQLEYQRYSELKRGEMENFIPKNIFENGRNEL